MIAQLDIITIDGFEVLSLADNTIEPGHKDDVLVRNTYGDGWAEIMEVVYDLDAENYDYISGYVLRFWGESDTFDLTPEEFTRKVPYIMTHSCECGRIMTTGTSLCHPDA